MASRNKNILSSRNVSNAHKLRPRRSNNIEYLSRHFSHLCSLKYFPSKRPLYQIAICWLLQRITLAPGKALCTKSFQEGIVYCVDNREMLAPFEHVGFDERTIPFVLAAGSDFRAKRTALGVTELDPLDQIIGRRHKALSNAGIFRLGTTE